MAGEEGFPGENCKQFAELGWLAVPFAEADGGYRRRRGRAHDC